MQGPDFFARYNMQEIVRMQKQKKRKNCTPLPGLERLNLVNFLIVQIGGEKQSPTEE